MKILVTGSAGFMGSHLVDYLITKKHKVFGLDNLSGGYNRNINPKSKFHKLDLRNKNKTIQLITQIKPEIIYHLAADATEGRSQFTPIFCTENNYLAYLHLLTGAIKAKTKRIVMTSSMSVYGAQTPPFSETMNTLPEDIYGVSKASMEEATQILAKVHGFEYTILRPHNVYGPGQNLADPYRNVIGIFINRLMQNKNFYIYGDGNQKRSFTYIEDITPCIANAGLLNETIGEIINIGPRQEYSINEIAAIIQKIFAVKNQKQPEPVYLPLRPREVINAYCTDEKSKKLLNFQHKTTIENGISKMVQWAKALGPQKFKYLKNLELITKDTPKTWTKKMI